MPIVNKMRMITGLVILTFSTFTMAGTGYASTEFNQLSQSSTLSNFEKRQIYQNLIYLIKTNQRSKYKATLKSQLKNIHDYPLFPYLEYTEKRYRISRQSEANIQQFVNQYQDTPLANLLLQTWLTTQAKNGRWQNFINNYDATKTTSKNRCYQAYALYKNKESTKAFQMARKLWLVNYSQPDACDAIFKVWRDAGQLSRDMAWQRFELALTANRTSLASYLTRFVHKSDRDAANNFISVHKHPINIKKYKRYGQQDEKTQRVVLHGIKRLARKNPNAAIDVLAKYKKIHEFNLEDLTSTYAYIALRIAKQPDFETALRKIPINLSGQNDIIEAKILSSLRALRWRDALVYLHQLDAESAQSDRWQYWQARILMQSKAVADQDQAKMIFKRLAATRSFYGFMAADISQMQYNYNDHPININQEEIQALEETPGIQRALELFSMNEKTSARREWNFTTHDFSSKEHQIAAKLAQKWGWYKQSIQATINAATWDDLDTRFPVAYHNSFMSSARTADIPPSWSLAIARQESAFMPDARSGAGALGIMQLLPSTARYAAAKVGLKTPSKRQLTDAPTNIAIGSAYLGQMYRKFDHSRILASAAYNAGPNRAKAWRNDLLPVDIWIETIPFKETRQYVMNILVFSNIYQRRLNQRVPMLNSQERSLILGERQSLDLGPQSLLISQSRVNNAR